MKELLALVAVYLVGVSVGVFVFSDYLQMTKTIGATYTELSSMKRECELVILRNQECVASIVFLPTAIEE